MADNVFSIIVDRYLRSPNAPPTQQELVQLLKSRIPTLTGRTRRQGVMPPRLPQYPAGVSFIPHFQRIGTKADRVISQAVMIWAKNIMTNMARLFHGDQLHLLQEYRTVRTTATTARNLSRGLIFSWHYTSIHYPERLPYYDRYPLTLVLQRQGMYVSGINFHYLPVGYRTALFESLIPFVAPIPVDQLSRVYTTYRRLANNPRATAMKPAFKTYRLDRIRNPVIALSPLEWAVALAYPSQQFVGASVEQVWHESILKINTSR